MMQVDKRIVLSPIIAIFIGILVSIIWATSFVFVKILLPFIGPLTIAGLRYFLAFLILIPFFAPRIKSLISQSSSIWIRLLIMGICAFTIGNGAVFWGLKYLPATTVSLMMSFIPLLILFMSIFWLKEKPTSLQIIGVLIAIIGSALFFYSDLQGGHHLGIIFVIVGLIGFSVFGILGRELAKNKLINTLIRTSIPMGLGGGLLIMPAFLIEGIPTLSVTVVSVVLVLAFFHTAFGYFLYNKALEKLTALEMNTILNLMPLGTAFFAWLLLGENITIRQLVGIFIVISGVVMVQMGNTNKYQKSIS